jgi:protein SCO1/2
MTAARFLLALAAAAALACGHAQARVEPFDPFGAAGVDPKPGAQAPLDGAFRDAQGRAVTLRQLAHGKPLVIAPVQHHCPNICGLTLEGLRDAVAGQGYAPGRDFTVVALGIDPKEGPADAVASERHLAGAAGAPGIYALVGGEAQIRQVTDALGYRYAFDPRIGQYAHIAAVAVLTPKGRLARWLYGVAPRPQDLHLALTDAGRGRLGSLGDQIVLLCYHYDPTTGRYSSLVMNIMRGVGLATAAGLALLIALFVRRDRARRRPA